MIWCEGEVDGELELMQVSSDNMAILQAEADRLVKAGANSVAECIRHREGASLTWFRCDLAAIVVINARIRGVFNNVQVVVWQCVQWAQVVLRSLEKEDRFPEVTAGSALARAMSAQAGRGSLDAYRNRAGVTAEMFAAEHSTGQHFWHQLTALKLSETVDVTQAAVERCLDLCNQVAQASFPRQQLSTEKVLASTPLAKVQANWEVPAAVVAHVLQEFLASSEVPISKILDAMLTSAVRYDLVEDN